MENRKEMNEKVAILEAVLRKKLNAPMAMAADASSEQNEEDILLAIEQNQEHILQTIAYRLSDDSIVGEHGQDYFIGVGKLHSDALLTKAFDCAMTKACFEYLSNYMDNLPKLLADFNMEQLGSIYPFTNESNCDFVDDDFVKRISYDICDFFDENCKSLQTVLDMGIKCVL